MRSFVGAIKHEGKGEGIGKLRVDSLNKNTTQREENDGIGLWFYPSRRKHRVRGPTQRTLEFVLTRAI